MLLDRLDQHVGALHDAAQHINVLKVLRWDHDILLRRVERSKNQAAVVAPEQELEGINIRQSFIMIFK